MTTEVQTFTWPKLHDAPDGPGVYAWYVRLFLGEADLKSFEAEVGEAKASGADAGAIVEGMLERHFFHPFQENPYFVKLSGALKPRYSGSLAHEPTRSEGLIRRLSEHPERLRPIAQVLGRAAPFFTAPLYIGMAVNLRSRLLQHKKLITQFSDNPGVVVGEEGMAGFARQVVQRGFNPTHLFVACIPIGNIENDEQVDLENILNRINFPIFGRN